MLLQYNNKSYPVKDTMTLQDVVLFVAKEMPPIIASLQTISMKWV